MLISETHFITRTYIKIPTYTKYDTQHSDGTAHGGTANINPYPANVEKKWGAPNNAIRWQMGFNSAFKVFKLSWNKTLHEQYNLEHLQATRVAIEDWIGPLKIVAVLNTA